MCNSELESFLSESTRTGYLPLRRAWIPFAIALGVIVIDQATKSLAQHNLSIFPHHVFGPFGFQLTYNTGSSFSLFSGSTTLLMVLDVIFVVVLGVVAFRTTSTGIREGMGLILGGALGNLIDRFLANHNGGVVDFVTLTHWPTFNGADSAITIGVIVVIVSLLFDRRTNPTPDPSQ